MLTAKDIGKLITQPELVSSDQLNDIAELGEKYPYAQLFSILYLKGMHTSESLDFETALHKHSYKISDRVQLYKLIHDHEMESEVVGESDISTTPDVLQNENESDISTALDVQQNESESDSLTTPDVRNEVGSENDVSISRQPIEDEDSIVEGGQSSEEDASRLRPMLDEEDEITLELNTEEALESDSEIESVDTKEEIVTSDSEQEPSESYPEEADLLPIDIPDDPLEEGILHHAVAQHYQLEDLSPEEEAAMEERQKESSLKSDISATSDVQNEREGDISTTLDVQQNESESDIATALDVRNESEDLTEGGKLSFTGWLHSNENYEEREDEQALIKAVVEEFSDFDPMETLFGEVQKPKKEFFSPAKKAKESLDEGQLPVSETLAKIYVMQGNYPKAIEAYNELILAFPEKKIFFANQIEDLQKKLNT